MARNVSRNQGRRERGELLLSKESWGKLWFLVGLHQNEGWSLTDVIEDLAEREYRRQTNRLNKHLDAKREELNVALES